MLERTTLHLIIAASRETRADEESPRDMSSQPRPEVPAVSEKTTVVKMKIRYHVYPDARSTTRMGYRSAWSRRFGRSARA